MWTHLSNLKVYWVHLSDYSRWFKAKRSCLFILHCLYCNTSGIGACTWLNCKCNVFELNIFQLCQYVSYLKVWQVLHLKDVWTLFFFTGFIMWFQISSVLIQNQFRIMWNSYVEADLMICCTFISMCLLLIFGSMLPMSLNNTAEGCWSRCLQMHSAFQLWWLLQPPSASRGADTSSELGLHYRPPYSELRALHQRFSTFSNSRTTW